MATFDDARLQRIAVEVELPKECITWFKAQGVNCVNGTAMACTTEAEVKTMCIDPMKAADVEPAKILGNYSKLKEFWILARDEWANGRKQTERGAGEDEKIPDRECKDLAHEWFQKHHFVFPDNMSLVESQQCKLWKQVSLDPPQLEPWFAQKIRHKGESAPTHVGHTISVVGKSVESLQVVLDVVEDKMELYEDKSLVHDSMLCFDRQAGFLPVPIGGTGVGAYLEADHGDF